jgi:hypothetical protein
MQFVASGRSRTAPLALQGGDLGSGRLRTERQFQIQYVEEGSQTISLEELRRVFGLESIKDPECAQQNIKAFSHHGRVVFAVPEGKRKPLGSKKEYQVN